MLTTSDFYLIDGCFRVVGRFFSKFLGVLKYLIRFRRGFAYIDPLDMYQG